VSSDLVVRGILLVLVFMSLTYFQRRRRRSPHTGKSRFCFHRGSAGNALHQLRAYVHPHVKHAIVQMQKQEVTEDNSLDNQDAVAHLHSQAVRIQKGEQVDRITALVPDENAAPEFDATGVPFKVLTDEGYSDSPDRGFEGKDEVTK
jgi:hypothetical protein